MTYVFHAIFFLSAPTFVLMWQRESIMPVSMDVIIREMSPSLRKKVEARTAELIREEMTLRELRRVHKLAQFRVGKALGIKQKSVLRLEKRSDLLFSMARKTIEGMGGSLSVLVEFPDREPIFLSNLAGDEILPRLSRRKRLRV
jgi:DNA-binding XRE family transcriptional regulator